jgi:hypothetical protein
MLQVWEGPEGAGVPAAGRGHTYSFQCVQAGPQGHRLAAGPACRDVLDRGAGVQNLPDIPQEVLPLGVNAVDCMASLQRTWDVLNCVMC